MNVLMMRRRMSDDMLSVIVDAEAELGHERIVAAPWLVPSDWKDIVVTRDGSRVRLVLLYAVMPCTGAFTRLIAGIEAEGSMPVIVEPSQTLVDWCKRHDYRERRLGRGKHTHRVWYPR